MKRLIAVGLIVVCGCGDSSPPDNKTTFRAEGDSYNYELVELDGCEYFRKETGAGESRAIEFAHRGSCKRCWDRLIEAIHAKPEKEIR